MASSLALDAHNDEHPCGDSVLLSSYVLIQSEVQLFGNFSAWAHRQAVRRDRHPALVWSGIVQGGV